jgi:hypothetical protein
VWGVVGVDGVLWGVVGCGVCWELMGVCGVRGRL